MLFLFLILLNVLKADSWNFCAPAFGISSPSWYTSKYTEEVTNPGYCFQMNLRLTENIDNSHIIGFGNLGFLYSKNNDIIKLKLKLPNNRIEEIADVDPFVWHSFCVSYNEASGQVDVYQSGNDGPTTFNSDNFDHTTDTFYLLEESKNIGTIGGIVFAHDISSTDAENYFDGIIPTKKIELPAQRIYYNTDLTPSTIKFSNLKWYIGEKINGYLSASRDSIPFPIIDEGCNTNSVELLPIHQETSSNKKFTSQTTDTQFVKTNIGEDANYMFFQSTSEIEIKDIDTNNKRYVKLEFELQGNYKISYLLDGEWIEGFTINAKYFTPNYPIHLPYTVMGSKTSIKIKTISTSSASNNVMTDPFIKEIRLIEKTCGSDDDESFCAKDNMIGKCKSSSCETNNAIATKSFDFQNILNDDGSIKFNSFVPSVENSNVQMYLQQSKEGDLQIGNEDILGTAKKQFMKIGGTVNFLFMNGFDVPSGFGRFSNAYTMFVTIRLDGNGHVALLSNAYAMMWQSFNLIISSTGIKVTGFSTSETLKKQIKKNEWIKIGIKVNSTHIIGILNDDLIYQAENLQFTDYLSSTALKLEAIQVSENSIAGVQFYPTDLTENEMKTISKNYALIENKCDAKLPNICVGGFPSSPLSETCSVHCNKCDDGKCTECKKGFDANSNCDKCSEGFENYPECKEKEDDEKGSNLGLILGIVIPVVVIIIIIIILIVIIVILKLKKKNITPEKPKETEMKTNEAAEAAVLLKEAKKKKVTVGDETLIEMGSNIYINKARLDFNLDGKEPNIDTALQDTLIIRNHTQKQFVIWIQLPTKDKFSLRSDVEKEILEAEKELVVNFVIHLHCNCSCKEQITIKIEDTKTKEVETGTISLAIATYNSHKIDFDEIELKQPPLGDGAFGIVYRGTYRGREVAVKKLKERTDNSGAIEEFQKEVTLMNRLRGPYIIDFIGACYLPQKMCIAIEFAPEGSLGHVIKKKQLSYEQKLKFMLDCCRGMEAMHAENVIHRDLKPDNLLVFSITDIHPKIVNCKVTDFGTSRAVQEYEANYTTGIGTPVYMAPEILNKQNYTTSVDQFSFAVMLYEVFIQDKPYPKEQFKMPWDIAKFVIAGKRLEKNPEMTDVWWSMIEQCWDHEPTKRPQFKDVGDIFQDELGTLNPAFVRAKVVETPKETPDVSLDPSQKTLGSTTTQTLTSTLTSTMTSDMNYATNQTGMSQFLNDTVNDFEVESSDSE